MYTTNNTSEIINVVNARNFVKVGEKLRVKLTKEFEGVGVFANAIIEKMGQRYSVSGLFKDYFGEVGTYVMAEVVKFDTKGKISFRLCEELPKENNTKEEVSAPVLVEEPTHTEEATLSFEEELQKAKEEMQLEMKREFEEKLKLEKEKMKQEILGEERNHVVREISKITGSVSPQASAMLKDMFEKASAAEIGKALAVVAANHDSSKDFVMKMEKVLWGCL